MTQRGRGWNLLLPETQAKRAAACARNGRNLLSPKTQARRAAALAAIFADPKRAEVIRLVNKRAAMLRHDRRVEAGLAAPSSQRKLYHKLRSAGVERQVAVKLCHRAEAECRT